MWKRGRRWLLLIALVGVALVVYFEPTHCVRGWLWGEAFFDGRPTSWWRAVIERDLRADATEMDINVDLGAPRRPTWLEQFKTYLGYRPHEFASKPIVNVDARSVLESLEQDADPDIAGFAEDVLSRVLDNPEFLDGRIPVWNDEGEMFVVDRRHGHLILRNSKNPKSRDGNRAPTNAQQD